MLLLFRLKVYKVNKLNNQHFIVNIIATCGIIFNK